MTRFFVTAGIRPQQIAKEALERGLNKSINLVDILHRFQLRRNSSVHTEVISVNIGRNRHAFETFDELLIHLLIIVFSKDLFPESKMLRHGPALVVASEHHDFLWIAYLERVQENAHLY